MGVARVTCCTYLDVRAFDLPRQVRPRNDVLFTCEWRLYARPAMSSPKSSDRKSSARKQSFSQQRSSNEDIYQQEESYDTPVRRDRALTMHVHKYLPILNVAHNYYCDDNVKNESWSMKSSTRAGYRHSLRYPTRRVLLYAHDQFDKLGDSISCTLTNLKWKKIISVDFPIFIAARRKRIFNFSFYPAILCNI